MKITICGSIAFYDEMLEIKKRLESLNHEVKLPPVDVKDENGNIISVKEYYNKRKAETNENSWIWARKNEAMKEHLSKVEWADAILVLNYDKKGVKNYVGGNTLLEMGVAFHLGKKMFLLNNIPDLSYKEEILGMKPIVINGDFGKIL